MAKKIYIAGRMRGIPYYNFPAFDAAAERLRRDGWEVINPADIDRANGHDAMTLPEDHDWAAAPEDFDLAACIRDDLNAVQECDALYMLSDWERSIGATAEHAVAVWAMKTILYEEDGADWERSK